MIVKEKDACMYDCPQKLASGADVSFTMCRGQGCMAWRWATEDNPDWVSPGLMAVHDPRKNSLFVRSKTHGYCGIAGQA